MLAYKDTDLNMCCLGFQYRIGEIYSLDPNRELRICSSGFHACRKLKDVLEYYPPCDSRYFLVELLGNIIEKGDKCVTSKIKFIREIDIKDFDKTDVDQFFLNSPKTITVEKQRDAYFNKYDNTVTLNHRSASISTLRGGTSLALGELSLAMTTEMGSLAVSKEYGSKAVAESNDSIALSMGGSSCAQVKSKRSIAISVGWNATVISGPVGSGFVLAEYLGSTLYNLKAFIVDGTNIKPYTEYKLSNGELLELPNFSSQEDNDQ